MSKGWIKLHRKLVDWEWYSDINVSRLFVHLMITANHKDNNWRGIEIKRGSRLTSLDKLSSETNLSVSKIRKAIKKLISTNEVASKSHSQHTVFIMINYDEYQVDDKRSDKPIANLSQTNDKRIATNKNDKNDNNDKNVKEVTNDRFAEFWNLYGKKTDSSKCKTKFARLTKSEIEILFDKLPLYIKSTPDVQFRKNPITWLNGKCWNDEVILQTNQAKSTHTFETQNYQSGKF